MKAEMALFAVARLETFKRDSRAGVTSKLGTGTGFFYRSKTDTLFLITNKHVVYNRARHYFPDRLRFYVHSNYKYLTKMKHIDIRLWGKDGKKVWKGAEYRPIDVAALEIPANSLAGCFFSAFSEGDMLDADTELLPGRNIDFGLQALAIGYPLGFYDENTFLPLARAATVATWPWLNFEGKPCFLVDARVHPGMSGSPVISSTGTIKIRRGSSKPEDVLGSTESYLLGILSDERTPWGEPLGLNTVWHASIIKKISNDR